MDDSDPISKLSLTALKTIIPHFDLQSSHFKYLHTLCMTYLRNHKKKEMTQQYAIDSCQHILDMYPSRGFFHLLHRWARKSKKNFLQDVLNTCIVLNSHFRHLSLSQFLQRCRTFTIIPASRKKERRRRLRIRLSEGEDDIKRIVTNIHLSIELLYSSVSLEEVLLSKVRMSSVLTEQAFKIPRSSGANDVSSSRQLVLNAKPLTGIQLPRSFKSRVWYNVLTLKLSSLLFKFLFLAKLQRKPPYPNLGNEDLVLQFLFTSTAELGTRAMFNDTLFHLALLFKERSEIADYDDVIDGWITSESENNLNREVQELTDKFDNDEIVERIAFATRYIQGQCERNQDIDDKITYEELGTIPILNYEDIQFQCVRWQIFDRCMGCDRKPFVGLKRAVQESLRYKIISFTPPTTNTGVPTLIPLPNLVSTARLQLPPTQSFLAPVSNEVPSKSLQTSSTTKVPCQQPTVPIEVPSQPHFSIPTYEDFANNNDRWTSCSIVDDKMLSKKLSTSLFVNTRHLLYILEASSIDVYSAGFLCKYKHYRKLAMMDGSANRTTTTTNVASVVIPSRVTHYLDPNDILHVVRRKSPIFDRHFKNLNSDLLRILKFVIKHGKKDELRGKGICHRVMEFGIKAELGDKGFLYGEHHFLKVKDEKEREMVRLSIGSIVDFIWACTVDMQTRSQHPDVQTNADRHQKYGVPVNTMVGAQTSMYKSITLKWVPVHPVVAPITTTSIEHTDDLNETVQATSKTGCVGVMLQDSKESIHYLQLLCNFRKAASFKDSPHSKKIPLIVKHIGDYHSILKRELGNPKKNYTGTLQELSFLRDPTDLQDFFVDKFACEEELVCSLF